MIERAKFMRLFGSKTLVGAGLIAAAVAAAGCGSSTSTAGTSTSTSTTSTNALTACHATVADITAAGGGAATAPNYGVSGNLNIDGSSALAPLFVRIGAEFDKTNGTHTAVTANGSGKGLSDINAGAVDIGLSDLFQADKKISGLTDHQVAVVAFALVVSPDLSSKVQNLSLAQIKGIYTGTYTNWSQLGGPNELITVVNRPTNSGTRGTFEQYVLGSTNEVPGNTLTQDTTGAVFDAVSGAQGAIGYVSTGFVTSSTGTAPSVICIDGAKPDATDINSGKYVFWNIEHAYTKGPATGAAKAILQYAESKDVQSMDLPALNYYQVSTIQPSALTTHQEAGAPAPESFYP